MTAEQRQILSKFQWADERLYAHFSAKFQRQVEEFGIEKMEAAVEELKVS